MFGEMYVGEIFRNTARAWLCRYGNRGYKMKKAKVIAFVLMVVLFVTLCGSCRTRPGPRHDQVDELVRCLNEQDEEGIMNLFCEETKSSASIDFDKQISEVFDLFADRTIASYDWRSGGSELSWSKGKKTWERAGVFIEKIELSDGSSEIEDIVFSTTLVDEENPNRVGLAWIKIITDEEEEYRIGEPKVN